MQLLKARERARLTQRQYVKGRAELKYDKQGAGKVVKSLNLGRFGRLI